MADSAGTGISDSLSSQPEAKREQFRSTFLHVAPSMFLGAIDQTIIAAALPAIAGSLGGLSYLAWVVTAYLLAATAQSTALGMLLAVPERAFYPHYARIATTLGISAVDDQMIGGGLMWSGAHMYLLPILMILYGVSRDAARERDDAPV